MAQILSRSNINTWGTHQLLTISRNHAATVNPTELLVDDEIRQSSSLSPRTVVHKSPRGHKGQTLQETWPWKRNGILLQQAACVVQNVTEIFNSSYSKAYHLFPSIKQLSQGLGAFLMIQEPFTITNSFPLNPEILSRVPNLEYTYSAVYHKEENHYKTLIQL